jgi:hypothetical protein
MVTPVCTHPSTRSAASHSIGSECAPAGADVMLACVGPQQQQQQLEADEKTLGAELRVAPSSTNSLGLITVHLSLIKTRTDTIMHSLDFVPPLRTGERVLMIESQRTLSARLN